VERFRSFDLQHLRVHDAASWIESYGLSIMVAGLFGWTCLTAVRRPDTRRRVLVAVVLAGLAWLVTLAGKRLVRRAPPYAAGLIESGHHPVGSFPEGPGAVAVAFAVALWPVARPLALAWLAFALFDGLMQLLNAAHWPTDLLAAWLVGLGAGLAARRVSRGIAIAASRA
jgi:hypothetical protein